MIYTLLLRNFLSHFTHFFCNFCQTAKQSLQTFTLLDGMKQALTNLQGSLPWSCHPGIGGLAIKIIAWKPLQWSVTLFLIKQDLWCSWPKIGDTRRKKRPPLMTRDGAAECNLSQTGLYIICSLKQLTCAHFFRFYATPHQQKGKHDKCRFEEQLPAHCINLVRTCWKEVSVSESLKQISSSVVASMPFWTYRSYGDSETGHSTQCLKNIWGQSLNKPVSWSSGIFQVTFSTETDRQKPKKGFPKTKQSSEPKIRLFLVWSNIIKTSRF